MATAFAQQTTSADSERDKDVYAIYSLLLTNPETSHGRDDNERYLIAPTTAAGVPPIPCVAAPKERQADFREVLADYDHRKGTQRALKPLISISKPYLLLTEDEVKGFIAERMPVRASNKPTDERFHGDIDLFRLTDVYFNPARTLALVQIST